MSLSKFKNVKKSELSTIEVAKEILSENGDHKTMPFSELNKKVQGFIGSSSDEKTIQFYSNLNSDGSFISLGNNEWGLRSWYPIDAINETVHGDEESSEAIERATVNHNESKKVNAFADGVSDDVIIDYNDDDPEDIETLENEDIVEEQEDVEDDPLATASDGSVDEQLSIVADNDLDDLSDGDKE